MNNSEMLQIINHSAILYNKINIKISKLRVLFLLSRRDSIGFSSAIDTFRIDFFFSSGDLPILNAEEKKASFQKSPMKSE